jgi:hypothetical protein
MSTRKGGRGSCIFLAAFAAAVVPPMPARTANGSAGPAQVPGAPHKDDDQDNGKKRHDTANKEPDAD